VAVGLLLAVGLYFVLDVVSLQYLESRGADQIARVMAAESATLDLGNVPFLPGFITGRLGHAEVKVRGASAPGGLRVQSVTTSLSDVRFSASRMFALARSSFAARTKVEASQTIGSMELAESDLEDFVQRAVPLIGSLEVKASGIEVNFLTEGASLSDDDEAEDDELTKPARYLPRVESGRIVLIPTSVSQIDRRFRAEAERIRNLIELPQIPEGLSAVARLGEGVVVVEVQGPEVELTVGEGNPDE
jgi:hypothetical protein